MANEKLHKLCSTKHGVRCTCKTCAEGRMSLTYIRAWCWNHDKLKKDLVKELTGFEIKVPDFPDFESYTLAIETESNCEGARVGFLVLQTKMQFVSYHIDTDAKEHVKKIKSK